MFGKQQLLWWPLALMVWLVFAASAVNGITSNSTATITKRNAAHRQSSSVATASPMSGGGKAYAKDLKGGESRYSNVEPEYYNK